LKKVVIFLMGAALVLSIGFGLADANISKVSEDGIHNPSGDPGDGSRPTG
jgi:hypothetical protein